MRLILAIAALSMTAACSDGEHEEDAGPFDGGAFEDAGREDAGREDAGREDAGRGDAGGDAGRGDAGGDGGRHEDGGPTDVGLDARGVCDAPVLELGVERIFGVSNEGDCFLDDAELFEIDLTETSDVRVTVRVLYDEDADPDSITHYYSAFLRDGCDLESESRFPGQACTHWSPGAILYPGSPTRTFDAAHVAAGSHLLEVRGSVFGSVPLEMAVVVEASPSIVPECTGGTELELSATGRTDGPDSFRFTCEHFLRGPPVFVSAPERVHRLVVSEPERWQITARSEVAPVRISLHAACDPGERPEQCVEATSGCNVRTLDALLEPGEYFVRVEGRFGGELDYTLHARREPIGASCAAAPAITTSGTIRGNTTGATDDFRASEPCADGSGPDDVWRIDVATAGYFAADFVFAETFANAYLTLRDACGGEPIRQHNGGVSWSVEPGTYYLTVDGMSASDFGAYAIDVTMP